MQISLVLFHILTSGIFCVCIEQLATPWHFAHQLLANTVPKVLALLLISSGVSNICGDVPTQPQKTENSTQRHHRNGPDLGLWFQRLPAARNLWLTIACLTHQGKLHQEKSKNVIQLSLWVILPLQSFLSEQEVHTTFILQQHHPLMIQDTCCPAAQRVGPLLEQWDCCVNSVKNHQLAVKQQDQLLVRTRKANHGHQIQHC